jgi:hypothetical protein
MGSIFSYFNVSFLLRSIQYNFPFVTYRPTCRLFYFSRCNIFDILGSLPRKYVGKAMIDFINYIYTFMAETFS